MTQLVVALVAIFGACVLIAAPPSRAFSQKAARAVLVLVAGAGTAVAIIKHRATIRDLRDDHAAQVREICKGEGSIIMEFRFRVQRSAPRMPQNEMIDRWSELLEGVSLLWDECVESPPACNHYFGMLPTEDNLAQIERAFNTGDSCGRSHE